MWLWKTNTQAQIWEFFPMNKEQSKSELEHSKRKYSHLIKLSPLPYPWLAGWFITSFIACPLSYTKTYNWRWETERESERESERERDREREEDTDIQIGK